MKVAGPTNCPLELLAVGAHGGQEMQIWILTYIFTVSKLDTSQVGREVIQAFMNAYMQ